VFVNLQGKVWSDVAVFNVGGGVKILTQGVAANCHHFEIWGLDKRVHLSFGTFFS
jgi:hypothetical protein